ncbi:DUF3795 domain-containing protein [Candidatus Thorarchaeota archaeon]|nr:MAG: DUF3795 domain-containing protein [Candidatus Thorarchaeota archaeon]
MLDGLGTPCLLYCGSCRFLMNGECNGCGSSSRAECEIYHCCRFARKLTFCTECTDFPCEKLSRSIGVHPEWLKEQSALPMAEKLEFHTRADYPSYSGFIPVY